jgi:hypothetical protein
MARAARLAEIAAGAGEIDAGRLPVSPFVLVDQQYLAEPGRSNGNVHPLYAYAQVPHGFSGDAGGDILTGAKNAAQLLRGPRRVGNPYVTGIPGSYLCSAATPPGPGAHGMCGANAAVRALRTVTPDLAGSASARLRSTSSRIFIRARHVEADDGPTRAA